MSSNQKLQLSEILKKTEQEVRLTKREVMFLLNLSNEEDIEQVFQSARNLRSRYFTNKVFLYGFVYFSTYCRNDCTFCYYRRSNKVSERYRKEISEIVETACQLTKSGVHLIDLTMGEDPRFFSKEYGGPNKLIEIADEVKKKTGLPIMISPGVVPQRLLLEMKKVGVNWYACYQETHNKDLYNKLRLNQSYDERLDRKKYARKIGLLIEEGLLTGVGDSIEDVASSLEVMYELNADQVRVMSFVPQKGTPMYDSLVVPRLRELLIIAVMRLSFPDRLIPASLDVDGIVGLKRRLDAGANVVTSIIPPKSGLLGVSQSSLDIEEGNRTVQGVLPVLSSCNLVPATQQEYAYWVEKRQGLILEDMAGTTLCG